MYIPVIRITMVAAVMCATRRVMKLLAPVWKTDDLVMMKRLALVSSIELSHDRTVS